MVPRLAGISNKTDDRQELSFCDYFTGKDGPYFIVSINQRCFRIILNHNTPFENPPCDYVIISTKYPKDNYYFIFEDNTDNPFIMQTEKEAFIAFLPSDSDSGREDIRCIVYRQCLDGSLVKLLDRPAKFRVVNYKENPLSKWQR